VSPIDTPPLLDYHISSMLFRILSFLRPRPDNSHIKVLVIEDTEVDQRITCAAIERGGYRALRAQDGRSGFELAKTQKPDLVILDFNLPDIKGPEVCKLLKTHYDTRQIPVLFLTSFTEPENVIQCFEHGENYLAKPVSGRLLLKQIDSILKGPKSRNGYVGPKIHP
jgi:two-component system alkaline phosphatase synthesis response regulator PhoP